MRYETVCDLSLIDLGKEVNRLLSQGYELVGGIAMGVIPTFDAVSGAFDGSCPYYVQAMLCRSSEVESEVKP